MKSLPLKKRVCVSLHTAYEHERGILWGIRRFAHLRPDVQFLLISQEGKVASEIERVEDVDGVIGYFAAEGPESAHLETARAAADGRLVGVSGADAHMDIPRVLSEDHAVGRMAAEHLMELGYRHFTYLVDREEGAHAAMRERYGGYSERLAESGRTSARLHVREIYEKRFRPAPGSAIFAFNLIVARQLIERLAESEIAVPEEVAVLGVDQDPFQQKLSPVPVSSISLNCEQIGFEAAKLMDRLLRGEIFAPGHVVRVPPLGVVARTSTERFQHDDPVIRKAVGLLRREIPRIASVAQCAALVGTSRSTLERRFRGGMGRTVREVMEAARVEHTKTLLLNTDQKLTEVAAAAGFGDSRMLSVIFRRVTGETPSGFRKRHRAESPTDS